MATDWTDYYKRVLANPTARPEAKAEAMLKLGLVPPAAAPQPATLPPTQTTATTLTAASTSPKTTTTQSTSSGLRTDVSIVDYLKSIGQPSDFVSRKKLAEQYGIKDYRGTAEQNIQLLALLKSGQKPTAGGASTTGGTPEGGVATTPPAETTITDPYQQFLQRMNQLLAAYERTLQATPPTTGLTPEERGIYEKTTEELRKRYEKALQDLERKHQQEQQRLIARYAAAGFSEPGILAGPMAGVPGVVTQALGEERERQARERATLEQAAAGDVLAAQQALAEAERRAREEEYNRWLKEQQQRLENLLKQAELYETVYQLQMPQFQIKEVGGRIYRIDQNTGKIENITPPEVEQQIRQKEILERRKIEVNPLTGDVFVIDENTEEIRRIGNIGATKEGATTRSGVSLFTDIAIEKVKDLLKDVSDWTVGIKSKPLRMIPGTKAFYFKAKLESLKSDLAFSVLSALRETSKSGGALGQVSNYEEEMLKSALGALNLDLNPDQFKEQLNRVLQILQEIPIKLQSAQQLDQAMDPLGLLK
jgi:hypothetical protein